MQPLLISNLPLSTGSFFSAFPVTGGTYRTAVNAGAGAQTPLAGAYSACIMLLPIFLPQMLYYVPRPCLAAIIIVSALPLVDCQVCLSQEQDRCGLLCQPGLLS